MAISTISRSLGTALVAAALAFGGAHDAYSQATGGGTTGGGTTGGTTGGGTTGGATGGGATTGSSTGVTVSGNSPHSYESSANSMVATPSGYATRAIVNNITAARDECAGYDPVYRIDCLSQRLRDVADHMPRGEAYDQAQRIISKASRDLEGIQASNVDHDAPTQRSRANPRLKGARTFSAIKRENLDRAMEQAKQVIEEAETQLLRATENSDKRASHYQQIAVALGSTKVLLRSA